MHPEYESYKKMGGLLGLFVGWWAIMDSGLTISLFMALSGQIPTFPIKRFCLFLFLHIVMFILLARRNILFRILFCISAFIWFWTWIPYPDTLEMIGNNVTPVLSIMYLFCSIRVDVYCGVWKGR